MEKEVLDQLIQDYEGLFYKVLQRCSIFPGQADYEDHLQELRLLLFLRAQVYSSRGHFEMENDVTYLFRHLMWRIVDIKRRKYVAVEEVSDEILEYLPSETIDEAFLATHDQFQRFYQKLSQKDQKKYRALLSDETLSRQKKSRYRQYFRKNFQVFFEKV